MLHKTRGIVLKTTDYSESSVIVQVFTEKFGMQSYLISGVKKSKGRIRMNMLQPLHLLDMIVYHKPSGNIQRISELRNDPVFESIPYDVVKSSLAIFLNEVLYRSIRQHSADERLFEFLSQSIEVLDHLTKGLANYHLWFLLQLTRYLGFYPQSRSSSGSLYFDLKNGVFTKELPLHLHFIQGSLVNHFVNLLSCNTETLEQVKLSSLERKELLTKMLEYYHLHIDSLGEIRSHLVLEEVLS
ncbi:DNA repair protein RecO [Arcticibacter tournemirensis]|uniref:DNA repair protein RecO n=1 Tax=Arcticibacter tournemirensis TaxID=699437 RepID=A0A4Q0M3X3_9SPHI|nr:DNA repair protein RecO [Arcticibacter tournemirensis]RXF67638.1 DNA repair protein RecO [Arcticibacter tournemirensis]